MKVHEAIKLLNDNGFVKKSQAGSHVKFQKGSSSIIIACNGRRNQDLGKGTIKQITNYLKK